MYLRPPREILSQLSANFFPPGGYSALETYLVRHVRDIQRCAPSRLMPTTEESYNDVFSGATVARIMTLDLSASLDLPLTAAIAMIQQSRFGCLPVVQGRELIGILSRSDLVDLLHRILSGQNPVCA